MLRSVFKIAAVLGIASAVVLPLKMRTVHRVNPQLDSLATVSADDISFFFIGSSRVQKSIDPKIVGEHYYRYRTFNLGVSSGTFLSSCVVADLMMQRPGHKVLFIELAPLMEELPDGVFDISSQTGLSPSLSLLKVTSSRSFSEQSMLTSKVINHQLFKSITVGEEIRKIIDYKIIHDEDPLVGFYRSDKNDSHNLNSFLTWHEINTGTSRPIDLSRYQDMINYLESVSKTTNSQIVFFLPTTCRTQIEKNIVIQLYQTLPDSMKLQYSPHFFIQLANEEYLGDENHLNMKGAIIYSRQLIPLLEKYSATDAERNNYQAR